MSKHQIAEAAGKWKVDSGELKANDHSQLSTINSPLKKGYKQTEVGVIPVDWIVQKLSLLGKFKNGINKDAASFGHGSPFVNLMDVFGKPRISGIEAFGLIDSTDLDKKEYDLKSGDILFIRSSVKPSGVGLTTVVCSDLPNTVYSGFLIRYRTDKSLSDEFKIHCFYEESFRKRIIASSTVSANTNINQDALKDLVLAFPSLIEEQTAIANALSDVDALINGLEKAIAKKQAIKTATMQQLLTGKIRLTNGELIMENGERKPRYQLSTVNSQFVKHPELGEVPEDWEVYSMSALCDVRDGTHDSPKYKDSGIPLVTSKNIVDDVLDLSDVSLISEKDAFDINKRSKVDQGDIIMSMIGTVGSAVLLVDEPKFCIKNVALFKPRRVQGEFLIQLIRSRHFQDYLEDSMDGGIQKFVSLGTLRNLELALPKADEQTAIATILSDMDQEIQTLQQRLSKTRQLKQGMMQELLTGRTRLISGELIVESGQ